MPMIVSFAWTTPALLAGAKTMTRRDWSISHAAKFRTGMLVDAWNYTPRVNSARRGIAIAHKVATIRIARAPYRTWSTDLTEEDYDREGFNWLRAQGLWQEVGEVVEAWGRDRRLLYVLEFELVERVCQCGAKIVDGKGGLIADGIVAGREDMRRQEWRCCAACAFEPTGCQCRFELDEVLR